MIVAFDVETDRLLDASRSNFADLRVTVAAAVEVGGDRRATAFYADPLDVSFDDLGRPRERPLTDLAAALDAADAIVAYNGRGFDLRVLRNHFASDAVDRWERRLIDPFEAMRAHTGSWVKLDELLEANGLDRKSGDGVSAVEWWAAGERRRVADYCCGDVEGLRALLEMDRFLFPVKRWSACPAGAPRRRQQAVVGWAELDWAEYARRSLKKTGGPKAVSPTLCTSSPS